SSGACTRSCHRSRRQASRPARAVAERPEPRSQSRLPPMTASQNLLADYARLAVRVGLNLQPGQVLSVNALLEHAPLARAVAREAYAAGAKYVDVLYSDQHVRRAHIQGAEEDALDWSPPWLVERLHHLRASGRGDARGHRHHPL